MTSSHTSSATVPTVQVRPSRGRRICLWLIFVGLVAVLSPVVALAIGYLKGSTPTLSSLLAEGDGILVAIAITADAIGRVAEDKKLTFPAIGCGLALFMGLLFFGVAKTQIQNHQAEIADAVTGLGKASPADDLKHLKLVISSRPYNDDRMVKASIILIGWGLFSAFLVVVGQES